MRITKQAKFTPDFVFFACFHLELVRKILPTWNVTTTLKTPLSIQKVRCQMDKQGYVVCLSLQESEKKKTTRRFNEVLDKTSFTRKGQSLVVY